MAFEGTYARIPELDAWRLRQCERNEGDEFVRQAKALLFDSAIMADSIRVAVAEINARKRARLARLDRTIMARGDSLSDLFTRGRAYVAPDTVAEEVAAVVAAIEGGYPARIRSELKWRHDMTTIRRALDRLVKAGRLACQGEGRYRWYGMPETIASGAA